MVTTTGAIIVFILPVYLGPGRFYIQPVGAAPLFRQTTRGDIYSHPKGFIVAGLSLKSPGPGRGLFSQLFLGNCLGFLGLSSEKKMIVLVFSYVFLCKILILLWCSTISQQKIAILCWFS